MDAVEKNAPLLGEEDEFHGLGDDILASCVMEPRKEKHKFSRAKKTLKQKALRVMLKRSGLAKPPRIESILEGKTGTLIPICDIGFMSEDNPKDRLLAELAGECPVRNRLNRDEITKSRVLAVGTEIFKAAHMWSPIHVHQDLSDGRYECVSGRHRLAFLALVYGSSLKIPVYLERLTLKAAREATAVANDSRPVKALERASYAILRAVGGDSEADQKKLYTSLGSLKQNIVKYCVYSVIERGHPEKLKFKLSERSSRLDGGITTVSNIEGFWNEALVWYKEMPQKEFDESLRLSVRFLNAFVAEIKTNSKFDPDQHLTANMLAAVGRYYLTYNNITSRNAIEIVGDMSKAVIEIVGSTKKTQAEIYHILSANMA